MDISNFTLLLLEAWFALDSEGILKFSIFPLINQYICYKIHTGDANFLLSRHLLVNNFPGLSRCLATQLLQYFGGDPNPVAAIFAPCPHWIQHTHRQQNLAHWAPRSIIFPALPATCPEAPGEPPLSQPPTPRTSMCSLARVWR